MKRVITLVQRKGMNGVLSHTGAAKQKKPDCAHCRHSRCEGMSFVCDIGRAIGTICERFRDARLPLNPNYLKTL